MSRRSAIHFEAELKSLVFRFRKEYELSYAEAVGVLEVTKAKIIAELFEDDDGEDSEHGDESKD